MEGKSYHPSLGIGVLIKIARQFLNALWRKLALVVKMPNNIP